MAGLGLGACVGRVDGRRIEGTIVGGAHGRGHRVRDGWRPAPARWEDVGVAILGGGIAGLSAAWALTRAGFEDFVVLELEDVPGGTSRSGDGPVTPYPWGAHYVPVPADDNRPLVRLLEEIGAVSGRDPAGRPIYAENVLCRDPQERVFFKGEWYEGLYPRIGASSANLAELGAFEHEMRRWAAWRDGHGQRAFALPRARSSSHPEPVAFDRISMADYLDARGWTSPRLRWLVEYACRDDFGTRLSQTSAWAGIHYHAARLPDERAEAAEFLTWPEGNGRVVRHLAEVAGARLRTGALVTEVTPRRDGVDVAYAGGDGAAKGLRASHAILALPRFVVPHLVSTLRGAPPPHFKATTYGSWMVANLTLSGRPRTRGFPLSWDNVIYDSPSLGYVVATHQAGRDHGATVFTYYLPLMDDDPRAARTRLLATTWDEWVERILADLAPSHPDLRPLVERVDVYLWGHAMVQPRPGLLWSEELRASARPIGRLHFAHTDLSGMALIEEAQYWGIRAAEAVMRERGHDHRSWLDAVAPKHA